MQLRTPGHVDISLRAWIWRRRAWEALNVVAPKASLKPGFVSGPGTRYDLNRDIVPSHIVYFYTILTPA